MLRSSTDLKLPKTLEKSPVVEQNNGRHESGQEQKVRHKGHRQMGMEDMQ